MSWRFPAKVWCAKCSTRSWIDDVILNNAGKVFATLQGSSSYLVYQSFCKLLNHSTIPSQANLVSSFYFTYFQQRTVTFSMSYTGFITPYDYSKYRNSVLWGQQLRPTSSHDTTILGTGLPPIWSRRLNLPGHWGGPWQQRPDGSWYR